MTTALPNPGEQHGPLRRAVAAVERRTPAHRDRGIDGLRALALLAVPTGHWLAGGFTRDADGALHNASALSALGFLAPVSWVLQLLGIFFLVGGYSSVLSYRRASGRGESTARWLSGRLARLGRPALAVTAIWALLIGVLSAVGVPEATLRTGATLVVQPLWFVGVYAGVTALTPYCVRAARRLGPWSAAPLFAAVAVVDFLRYGPYAAAVPSWLALLNLLPGWLFAYQLGVCWGEGATPTPSGQRQRGRLGRRAAWTLLTGGAAVFAVLLLVFHYPASMVGVPGTARTNSHPPSLLVPALAAIQCGAAVLLRDRIAALLRRPALWAPVVVVNLCAMTVFCWHQTAMLAVAVPSSYFGPLPGLTTPPDSAAWLLTRLVWLPLFALTLAALTLVTRRFEAPWSASRALRATTAALSASFALFALGMG